MRSAFIGLGGMGRGMAANLATAGHLVGVYNRSREAATRFGEAHGLAVFDSPAEAVAAADVVVLCVSADADVLEVIDALIECLDASKIVIDCSTVSADTAIEAARRVGSRGAAFVDAPVSGGTEGAQNATLSIMVGADADVFECIAPLLEAMGSRVTRMGGVGAGQSTKAVNQVLAAGINQSVCEALRFAEALDLDVPQVIDVVGAGAAGNWFINNRGKTMIRDVYEPGFKIAHHRKDLGICLAMAERAGARLPIAAETHAAYARLIEAGFDQADISALYHLKRELIDGED